MNERGSSTIYGVLIIFLSSLIMLVLIQHKIYLQTRIEHKQDLLLCTKFVNGEGQTYVQNIERSNTALVAGTVASLSPIIGVRSAAKAAVKALKLYQQIKRITFIKNILNPKYGNCNIAGVSQFSVYKMKGFQFKRDLTNRALLRNKKWKIITANTHGLIINSFSRKKGATKIKTRLLSIQ